MNSPVITLKNCKKRYKKEWIVSLLSAMIVGLLTHIPAFIGDFPNHDGLFSVYFDQNMITSGRWFLSIACGISTYFTIPWVIGILSILWLSITCVLLNEILDVHEPLWCAILSAVFVTFPTMASTYAYIFTADGYMLGLLFAVLPVYLLKKYPNIWGVLLGGLSLSFSLGIYQAYVSVTILLCLFVLAREFFLTKGKPILVLLYAGMGVFGAGLYYAILQILLKLEGKVLDTYQGINGMTSFGGDSLQGTLGAMVGDFLSFLMKSKVLFNNPISTVAVLLLGILFVIVLVREIVQRKLYKSIWLYVGTIVLLAILPFATNAILLISPSVNYHLLMRMQYSLFLVIPISVIANATEGSITKLSAYLSWGALLCGIVIALNFALKDNVGYSNLSKRYEKTYAYCLRLADRIEQTPGYTTGMPVAMIGVVGDWNFPSTDLTGNVTGNMIGLAGDTLCYNAENYKAFFKNYLGITIEVLDQDTIGEIYLTDEDYYALDSFPGEHCTLVKDGVLYVKTENALKLTGEIPQ